jgi:hypothetical protein
VAETRPRAKKLGLSNVGGGKKTLAGFEREKTQRRLACSAEASNQWRTRRVCGLVRD